MIALVTVLVAFPAGFVLRSRLAANVVYIAAFTWAYSFQGFYLVLSDLEGDDAAAAPGEFPWGYGLVTLAIYLAGFGLVALGHHVRRTGRGRTFSNVAPEEAHR